MDPKKSSRANRPASANTPTRFSATPAMTRPRSRSCGRPARWREGYGMPAYRLHYFPESGNSYKLALRLTLCGQSFEPVWTDFGGGVTRTDEWRRGGNPLGG